MSAWCGLRPSVRLQATLIQMRGLPDSRPTPSRSNHGVLACRRARFHLPAPQEGEQGLCQPTAAGMSGRPRTPNVSQRHAAAEFVTGGFALRGGAERESSDATDDAEGGEAELRHRLGWLACGRGEELF